MSFVAFIAYVARRRNENGTLLEVGDESHKWARADAARCCSYEASIRNLVKAVYSPRWRRPRPWRSEEEAEMVRRYAFWWFTCRDQKKPSGRDWARQLGISHTWLQKLTRQFQENPDQMWDLQRTCGDPTLAQLDEARERTQELKKLGGLHPRRRPRRAGWDE